jgi:hypothetical protein
MAQPDQPARVKPAARTMLNLGNLPPKRQGFGSTGVSERACRVLAVVEDNQRAKWAHDQSSPLLI